MLKTEAIQKFLHSQPYYMAKLYNPNLEVQINVSRGTGEPINGAYAGIRWHGFTDGFQTWKHFRIPWKASTNPEYTDGPIKFDMLRHTEAVGLTGWDFKNSRSRWVGFDFDSLLGHRQGLTKNEILDIQNKLEELDFIYLFTSTGGLGLHVYVFIQSDTEICNHSEHAAVARSILSLISGLTGISLEAKVDTLGGNMWVWHQNATEKSYDLLKEGQPLKDIPSNWKDYIPKIKRVEPRVSKQTSKDQLIASKNQTNLKKEHLKLIKWFENSTSLWWYDDGRQMIDCHTSDLKQVHQELSFKGFFDTIATGKDHGQDQNCFAFPLEGGGWIVRRHTKGVKEHESWFTDNSGWTTTYFNRIPTLRTATTLIGGLEGAKAYTFKTLSMAIKALLAMEIDCPMPAGLDNRPTDLSHTSDGRLRISFERVEHDIVEGWVQNKKHWEKFFYLPKVIDETELPDELMRHITISGIEEGWFLQTNNNWIKESKSNVVNVLISKGHKRQDVDFMLGQCILNNWQLVNKPFKPEYPGNREWNRKAAQFKYTPEEGGHANWDLIFIHVGQGLNDALLNNDWALNNGITNGMLYLQAWCASLIQFPEQPLPYLFLFGDQNTGKSIFHEALSLLFTSGYCRADQALVNQNGFNGELLNGILCVVEETNLSKQGHASDRIKDWVTGRSFPIHTKGKTPYDIDNCTHWIQCANDIDYCPVFPGDTRVTTIQIPILDEDIPKPQLLSELESEAPAFIFTLLNFELPRPKGRLRIPIMETEAKREQMEYNKDALQRFVDNKIYIVNGAVILFSDFFIEFHQWLNPLERLDWTSRRVGKKLKFIKGKKGGKGQLFLGNVSFEKCEEKEKEKEKLTLRNGRLV